MPPELHFDLAQVDCSKVLADKDAIRRYNPQRFEMEQLDAIVHIDMEKHLIVGYKDVRLDEFWVRGHMPDYPLLPGVLMCEAAAQLCSYFFVAYVLMPSDIIDFRGLEKVHLTGTVPPGIRLRF